MKLRRRIACNMPSSTHRPTSTTSAPDTTFQTVACKAGGKGYCRFFAEERRDPQPSAFQERTEPMAMTCKEVWREISNYIDDSVSPELREELELHLAYCSHCTAIVDAVHNIIVLVPAGRHFFATPSSQTHAKN